MDLYPFLLQQALLLHGVFSLQVPIGRSRGPKGSAVSLGFKDCPWGLSSVAATAVVTEAKKEDVATNKSNRMIMVYYVMEF